MNNAVFSEADIREAVSEYYDVEPEEHHVEEVSKALDAVNEDIMTHWDAYQDAIDENAHEIVAEDMKTITLADHTGHLWGDQLDAAEIERPELRDVVVSLHHTAAKMSSGYTWATATPVVIEKSSYFTKGERHVLEKIARRTDELGSVARAVDTIAVHDHRWQQSAWARATGRNPSTVSRTTDN